ncbi:MAG TPA: hypothetical protein PLJ43_11595 [Chitinophagales bacterium]|nr:hypothetical protein [Chitinophagales bacterium]
MPANQFKYLLHGIFITLLLLMTPRLNGQVFFYTNVIADIDKQVEKINDRKGNNGIRIAPWDSNQNFYDFNGPNIFGHFHFNVLEKAMIKIEEESGTQWTTTYYFKDNKLIHVEITCFRIAGFSGPTWYELAGKYRYWFDHDAFISSDITLIPPDSPYQVSFTSAELLDQATCFADLLYKEQEK